MNIQDAIDYAEAIFDCRMGFPGRYSDGPEIALKKNNVTLGRDEYVTLRLIWAPNSLVSGINDEPALAQHYLGASLIHYLDALKLRCATNRKRPILLWRHIDKIRFRERKGAFLADARVKIESCRDYGGAVLKTPDPVDYIQLVIDNTSQTSAILQLTHKIP